MEILSVLLMIAILVIIINQNGKLSQHLQKLEGELRSLRRQLLDFTEEKKKVPEIKKPEVSEPIQEQKPYKSLFTLADDQSPVAGPSSTEDKSKKAEELLPKKFEPETANIITTVEVNEIISPPENAPHKAPPPTFFERHPDMEKFIGENLISKIGIAILVLAIGFFVKYAIDQNWIGPVARVAIGILCGGILTALAHRFRNTYRGFSSVLAGGGIAARLLAGLQPLLGGAGGSRIQLEVFKSIEHEAVRRQRARQHDHPQLPSAKEQAMPFINVKLIEGVFSGPQKQQIAKSLTDAMVQIEGEALRSVTWCVVEEVKSGDWAIGGQPLTTADVKAIATRKAA